MQKKSKVFAIWNNHNSVIYLFIDSANLFKENQKFIRLKLHIAVTFSETNSAAATHQVFTFKSSAKQMILFADKHSSSLADFTLD